MPTYTGITTYIYTHLGHSNSQILLVSFPTCSGWDRKSQTHLFCFPNEHLLFSHLLLCGGNASPDMRAHVAYGFAARAKCNGHADCSLVGKLHFSLKLLPGEQFTDGSLLRRPLSVAVCLYFLHTLLLDTVNVH